MNRVIMFLFCLLLSVNLPARAQTSPAVPDLLTGKAFPATLPSAQIDGSFHFVDLVDAQGKPGTYATKGQTVPMAGETLLVTYAVPLTVALKNPARPQPDTTATLVLINLRFVQAILNIRDVPPAPPAVKDTPSAPAIGRNR